MRRPRSNAALASLAGAAALLTAGFLALGIWQIERRAWKLDLMARVEARIHAPAVPPPGPAAWPGIVAASDEYRRIVAEGAFDHAGETLVQAVTELGPGSWVLTPLATSAGFTLLVNRGFVPADRREAATRPAGRPNGPAVVTGLLRLSEPGGAFLRANDPAGGRWFSRDVAGIAAAHGLGPTAPYFMDADATPNPGGWPRGGLTVVAFRNEHLVYALTWICLAAMAGGGGLFVLRDERRVRRAAGFRTTA